MPHQWSHGHFYWNELMTRNAERDKKFYGTTVGWTFEAMPMPDGTYWVAKMGDHMSAACFRSPVPSSTAFLKAGCLTSRSTMSTRG
jgi:hypothetical protein